MSSRTNEVFVTGFRGFLEKNLFAIIIGAALIYSNFAGATANVTQLEKRIDRLESKIDKIYEQGLKK